MQAAAFQDLLTARAITVDFVMAHADDDGLTVCLGEGLTDPAELERAGRSVADLKVVSRAALSMTGTAINVILKPGT